MEIPLEELGVPKKHFRIENIIINLDNVINTYYSFFSSQVRMMQCNQSIYAYKEFMANSMAYQMIPLFKSLSAK